MTGLYFYDNRLLDIAVATELSPRGRSDITQLNQAYLDCGDLHVEQLSRGYAWFDTGTHDSLLEAGEFVRTLQRRQGLQIACLEEIAYQHGFISREQLVARGELLAKTPYGQSLLRLARNDYAAEPHPLATNGSGQILPPDRTGGHLGHQAVLRRPWLQSKIVNLSNDHLCDRSHDGAGGPNFPDYGMNHDAIVGYGVC